LVEALAGYSAARRDRQEGNDGDGAADDGQRSGAETHRSDLAQEFGLVVHEDVDDRA
jgi:hypothetical protein